MDRLDGHSEHLTAGDRDVSSLRSANSVAPKCIDAVATARDVPLVVDVDGTLVKTDLLYESLLQFVAKSPLAALCLAHWLLKGKSFLKTMIADRIAINAATLPLRDEVLAIIHRAQHSGRKVYLASASDRRYVEALAARVGGINGVFATESTTNLAGSVEALALTRAFGQQGFEYIGNANADFPIWLSARKALVVAPSTSFERKVKSALPNAEIVCRPRCGLTSYVKAIRVHQWTKNLLVFLPLVAGHLFNKESIAAASLAFTCFCLLASSGYLINDLLDLPGDRNHPTKNNRPFASGALPVQHGIILASALLITAMALSALLPAGFRLALLVYFVGTTAYSFVLKQKALVDVITLGGLYSIRVFGGVEAVGAVHSPWFLMFCLFLFLSLAIVKRCSELLKYERIAKTSRRGYRFQDLQVLFPLGGAAAYGSVFTVALYMSSSEVQRLYGHPDRLWLACPVLLYWISRVLLLSNRGELNDDPVVFALRDRISQSCAVLTFGIVLLAM